MADAVGTTRRGRGARAVLEVRSREVPFILEHGQIVGRLLLANGIQPTVLDHDGEAVEGVRQGLAPQARVRMGERPGEAFLAGLGARGPEAPGVAAPRQG